MRVLLAAAILPVLFAGTIAHAQMAVMSTPTPTLNATSPLGDGAGSPVSPIGIPLGATEVPSGGLSPLAAPATGTIAIPGNGAVCSTVGTGPTQMFGSSAMFDGGGTAAGSAAPATGGMSGTTAATPSMTATIAPTSSAAIDTSGMSGMCGSGSSSVIASSTPSSTSPVTMGGVPRTGIPLDSSEISNAGISSAAAIPTPGVSALTNTVGSTPGAVPVMPSLAAPTPSSSTSLTGANGCPLVNVGSITSQLPAICQ